MVVVTYQPSEAKESYLVVNHLTPKGRKLLRKLSEINNSIATMTDSDCLLVNYKLRTP